MTRISESLDGLESTQLNELLDLAVANFGTSIAQILLKQGFLAPESGLVAYSQYLANFWLEAYWNFYGAAFVGILLSDDTGWPEATAQTIVKSYESAILNSLDEQANHVGPEVFALISDLFSEAVIRAHCVGFTILTPEAK